MSQKALGHSLEPPVTTQFISNLERGITPVPANHIAGISSQLKLSEEELIELMEREYALRLAERAGKQPSMGLKTELKIGVVPSHYDFLKRVCDRYAKLPEGERAHFQAAVESWLKAHEGRLDQVG